MIVISALRCWARLFKFGQSGQFCQKVVCFGSKSPIIKAKLHLEIAFFIIGNKVTEIFKHFSMPSKKLFFIFLKIISFANLVLFYFKE